MFATSEKIQSNIQAFGEYEAARLLRKKVDFKTYYMLRFGRAPRAIGACAFNTRMLRIIGLSSF